MFILFLKFLRVLKFEFDHVVAALDAVETYADTELLGATGGIFAAMFARGFAGEFSGLDGSQGIRAGGPVVQHATNVCDRCVADNVEIPHYSLQSFLARSAACPISLANFAIPSTIARFLWN